MSNKDIPPPRGSPTPPRGQVHRSVKLGSRFAPSIAVRLDAHPSRIEPSRENEEKRLLAMIRSVLAKPNPERSTVDFLTSAVEVYTRTCGFSKVLYDELFRLHQQRLQMPTPEVSSAPAPAVPAPVPRRMGAANNGGKLAIPTRAVKV